MKKLNVFILIFLFSISFHILPILQSMGFDPKLIASQAIERRSMLRRTTSRKNVSSSSDPKIVQKARDGVDNILSLLEKISLTNDDISELKAFPKKDDALKGKIEKTKDKINRNKFKFQREANANKIFELSEQIMEPLKKIVLFKEELNNISVYKKRFKKDIEDMKSIFSNSEELFESKQYNESKERSIEGIKKVEKFTKAMRIVNRVETKFKQRPPFLGREYLSEVEGKWEDVKSSLNSGKYDDVIKRGEEVLRLFNRISMLIDDIRTADRMLDDADKKYHIQSEDLSEQKDLIKNLRDFLKNKKYDVVEEGIKTLKDNIVDIIKKSKKRIEFEFATIQRPKGPARRRPTRRHSKKKGLSVKVDSKEDELKKEEGKKLIDAESLIKEQDKLKVEELEMEKQEQQKEQFGKIQEQLEQQPESIIEPPTEEDQPEETQIENIPEEQEETVENPEPIKEEKQIPEPEIDEEDIATTREDVDEIRDEDVGQEKNVNQEKAAIKMQKAFRGFKARKEYKKKRDASVKLQSLVRGHQARKEFLKQQEAATGIQRIFRGFKARKEYKKKRDASVKLQSWVRGRQSRKEFLKQQEVVIKMQKAFRNKKQRQINKINKQISNFERDGELNFTNLNNLKGKTSKQFLVKIIMGKLNELEGIEIAKFGKNDKNYVKDFMKFIKGIYSIEGDIEDEKTTKLKDLIIKVGGIPEGLAEYKKGEIEPWKIDDNRIGGIKSENVNDLLDSAKLFINREIEEGFLHNAIKTLDLNENNVFEDVKFLINL